MEIRGKNDSIIIGTIGVTILLLFLVFSLFISSITGFNEKLLLTFSFGIGLLTQVVLLLKRKVLTKEWLLIIVLSFAAFVPSNKESVYSLNQHLSLFFISIIVLSAFLFKKDILPQINERSILQIYLIGFYLFFETFGSFKDWHSFVAKIILFFLVIISPVLLILIISHFNPGYKTRVALYIWFTLISLLIILSQTVNLGYNYFFSNDLKISVNFSAILEAFVTGMVIFPILTNSLYLYELLPIPGRRQSFADKIKQIKVSLKIMSDKFSMDQINKLEAFLIIIVFGGLLVFNYHFKILNPGFAITFAVLLTELIVYFKLDYWFLLRIFFNNGLRALTSK